MNNHQATVETNSQAESPLEAKKNLHTQQIDLINCIKVTGAASCGAVTGCDKGNYPTDAE